MTLEPVQREFVSGRRSGTRVSVRSSAASHATAAVDLDEFIERLRADVFDVYARVREAQRESNLLLSERAAMLGAAGERARTVADAINLYCAAPTLGLDPAEAFGVPI